MKIFVTIGTQAPFPRLERWVSEYAESHCVDICVQNMDSMLSEEGMEECMLWADVIVAHAGIGTLIKARSLRKRIVIVPRLVRLDEQRNDHQLDTCAFVREYGLAEVAETKEVLFDYLDAQRTLCECRETNRRYEAPRVSRCFRLDLDGLRVMTVSSFGGHTVELRQCLMMSKTNSVVKVCTGGECDYQIAEFSRSDAWKIAKVAGQVWRIMRKEKPDAVVSTGAAPGLVAIVVAWILGIRTIWIDSIATRSKLSLSGRLVKPFCKEYYVQWPELAKGRIKYKGNVLGL